jgi:hypothetical protein
VWGLLRGDGGDGVEEFVVEPAQHVQYLGRLGDWLVDVMKGIGEILELGVVRDVEVALVQAKELGLQVHDMVQLMVTEEIDKHSPDGVRQGVGNTDDVEDIACDGVVDLIN